VLDERVRVGEFLERWLAEVVKPGRAPETWRGYRSNVRTHIVPALGHLRLARLSAADVQALVNSKREQGLSPRSVQYVLAVLRAALSTAERWGLVARNVAKLVEPVQLRRVEVVPFTPEEAKRLLAVARGERLGALYTVALALGLRPGEALGLSWADVDLDIEHPRLRVRRALRRQDGQLVLSETKTPRSRRDIPIPPVCLRALREHRRRQLKERLGVGSAWSDSGLVFTTRIGTPLDHRNVARDFERLQAVAGVDRHRLYDCRHTAATLLLAQGVSARVVMEVLGHSTYRLTMDTYAHVIPTLLEDAADAMERALGDAR
jgi:integrase